MKKFYQVCYGKPSSGWESFNFSSDIPPGAISFFEMAACNNTPEHMDSAFVESGVDLFEIVSHSGFTEVSKVRYGMRDHVGRPMMFDHGFVFEADQGILEEPNNVVSVSDSNFKFSKEETAVIPEVLEYDEPFTVENALGITDLSNSQVINAAAALYYSLNSSMNYQTYIIYRGTERQKKALMYLLMCSIPYQLRYKLSFSTTDSFRSSMSKSVMIVDDIERTEHFIDLTENSTNIPLGSVNQYYDDYPFFAALKKYGLSGFDSYCKRLMDVCQRMGYPYLCTYNDLLNADLLLDYEDFGCNIGKLGLDFESADEYSDLICSFILSAPAGNELSDGFIADLLNDYMDMDLSPNDVLTTTVKKRQSSSHCPKLINAYEKLQMNAIVRNGAESTLKFLKNIKNDDCYDFIKWARFVNEQKKEYIFSFFESEIENADSVDDLFSVLEDVNSVNPGIDLREPAMTSFDRIVLLNMYDRIGEENAFKTMFDSFEKPYKNYFDKKDEYRNCMQELINRFFDSFDNSKISFSKSFYSNIDYLDDKGFTPVDGSFDYYMCTVQLKEKDTPQRREDLYQALLCLSRTKKMGNEAFDRLLYDKITVELNDLKKSGFKFWLNLATLHGDGVSRFSDVIQRLSEWEIRLFFYDDFGRELNEAIVADEIDSDCIYMLKSLLNQCEQFSFSSDTVQGAYATSIKKQLNSFFKDRKKDEKRLLKEEKHISKNQQRKSESAELLNHEGGATIYRPNNGKNKKKNDFKANNR